MSELALMALSIATAVAFFLMRLELNKLSNEVENLQSYKIILETICKGLAMQSEADSKKKD